MEAQVQTFRQFLATAFEGGLYATDDVIAFVLPLFKEVLSFHEAGLVGPFEREEHLFITGGCLDIDEHFAHTPRVALVPLQQLIGQKSAKNIEVVGVLRVRAEVEGGTATQENLQLLLKDSDPLENPAYRLGYRCYESLLGHHDAQSDIFCLGLVLGSMALGLDLYQEEDLCRFAAHRGNPSALNPRIHPTISSLIREMTELDRSKRMQDLYEVIERLEHYRDFDPERQHDLSQEAGWIHKELGSRNEYILNKLRNRLFDTSRRNRLLHYKPNMRFVNLTLSSVPMVLHYQSIRPELLFTWNKEIAGQVNRMKDILLNRYLRFDDHHYLPSSLNKIRLEAQRDVNEYGFSQLKLVVAFLNWHNLKENPQERIQSPLLLIPVELKKNKRIREDHYVLKVLNNEAEVNPVLANHLRELYGIKLPDFVDLSEVDVLDFYQSLKNQIDATNQGIVLNLIDKPRIKLVHTEARQTVVNYKKRLRPRGPQLDSYKNISFSYQQEHYKPLGLEIFRQYIEPRPTFLEVLINEDIKITQYNLQEPAKSRDFYELAESEKNPYSWDFDICNVVLGNFNYKKMSLVRDYNQVIDSQLPHGVFEELFSTKPKPLQEQKKGNNLQEDCYHVITADPTQSSAVLKSRSGQSYIIQGPPGTGKSQTITNLIADFVAQGKSVLFVCEKRAALDVVYHRLKQQGLEELCCYIHDSQSDKRSFIQNLKATYEDFIANRMDGAAITEKRSALLAHVQEQLGLIREFHKANNEATDAAGMAIRKLIERVIELQGDIPPLDRKEEEALPHYALWHSFGDSIQELSEALEETGAEATFADHPFSSIPPAVFLQERPLHTLEAAIASSQALLRELLPLTRETRFFPGGVPSLLQVRQLAEIALLLQPLAAANALRFLDEETVHARDFYQQLSEYRTKLEQHAELEQRNQHWKNKFSEQDTLSAIAIAKQHEGSFWSFFSGSWRLLKKRMQEAYAFSAHQVQPPYLSVLEQLKEEWESKKFLSHKKQKLQQQFGLADIEALLGTMEKARPMLASRDTQALIRQQGAAAFIQQLAHHRPALQQLEQHLQQCLLDAAQKPLQQLLDALENISMNLEALPDLLPALRSYAAMPEPLQQALATHALTPRQAEASMAAKTLADFCRQNRKFNSTDFQEIERAVQRIRTAYQQLLKLNAQYIRAAIRRQFLQHLELSNTALSQLKGDQKQFKKTYSDGRKILENEFGKSMRYKSIRELAGRESGLVLRDLKPVWLMSPLSVSDSLPLDVQYFDAIIFDEASQITLEEGIPALYRAPQTIIVGDDKQMPPSNFFSAKAEDPDDLDALADESLDELLSNEADSLLVQGARKLDSIMLGWHYRSRYETLISYSNHAFYNASLLTIPDKTIHHTPKAAIEVSSSEEGSGFAAALFDRSISFHYHPASVYEKRVNLAEADYIAHLVRELLSREVPESIGIVAFSQEQQHTIEDALQRLAAADKNFEQKLEEAYNRTEEDQFIGLFVKNLENVQGDERDIIIMSVCYGFDGRRKMIMNFGPINKKGGEKRLNVIFSRAKKHMAIVSSIKHQHITNEYNEGANYFKRFLHYAERISQGHTEGARAILDGLMVEKSTSMHQPEKTIVLQQIREELVGLGYEVSAHVGQSRFKCSLAVKLKPDDTDYTLGILVDDDHHYSNEDLLEQYYQRPEILQAFGWRIIQVFTKDWQQQKERVMKQLLKRLKEAPGPLPEPEAGPLPEAVLPEPEPIPSNPQAVEGERHPLGAAYDTLVYTRLVYVDERSDKFWETALEENKLIVRFGRSGSRGQIQFKTFDSAVLARLEQEKMIREKLKKGYLLQGAGQ
ncbi:AAA domain-containing protein [Cesiribacter andamanensis]|uniref:Putative DNA helicase n=1 Tax=Cesiribacter andamanensis AMV16 TaxID=1279009 RepID=M7MYM4_9BACT|nr:AAA domain-containing protein [Cesiribacter andamanensis]EMR01558.1 putative DNA helicase [Cesiribacter andamanensis AMV16]